MYCCTWKCTVQNVCMFRVCICVYFVVCIFWHPPHPTFANTYSVTVGGGIQSKTLQYLFQSLPYNLKWYGDNALNNNPSYFVEFSVKDFCMTSNSYNREIAVLVKLMLDATVLLWDSFPVFWYIFFVSQNANLFVSSWVKDIHYHGVLFKTVKIKDELLTGRFFFAPILRPWSQLRLLFSFYFNPSLKAFITHWSCQEWYKLST